MTKYPTQELKNKREARILFMSTEVMRNIFELGYPLEFYEASHQFVTHLPLGVIDYFAISGTWVVRKG